MARGGGRCSSWRLGLWWLEVLLDFRGGCPCGGAWCVFLDSLAGLVVGLDWMLGLVSGHCVCGLNILWRLY